MARYRLRLVSNGQTYRRESFDAADEASAIQRAASEAGAAPAELWCDDRRIHAFNTAAAAAH